MATLNLNSLTSLGTANGAGLLKIEVTATGGDLTSLVVFGRQAEHLPFTAVSDAQFWRTLGDVILNGYTITDGSLEPAELKAGQTLTAYLNLIDYTQIDIRAAGFGSATATIQGYAGAGVQPADDAPLVPNVGAGVVGTSLQYAREDHQHPSDAPLPATATPLAGSGSGAVGASAKFAREDHVHPATPGATPSNDVPLVATPTGNSGGSLEYARGDHAHPSDAPLPSNADPLAPGAAAQGTSPRYSRQDHVHPSDAPLASNAVPAADSASGTVGVATTYARGDHAHPKPGVTIQDEGVSVTDAQIVNFTGAGVTATNSGSTVTVNIPGGGGSAITAKDEGTNLTTALASLNFTGAGVTASAVGNDVTVDIPGGGSSFDPAITQSYGGTSGNESLKVTASGTTDTNFLNITGRNGIGPILAIEGAGTSPGFDMRTKGSGGVDFSQAAAGTTYLFRVLGLSGTAANHVAVQSVVASGIPSLVFTGTDTNVNGRISCKGTGALQLFPNGAVGYQINTDGRLLRGDLGGTLVTAAGNHVVRSYTTGALPSASTEGPGAIVRDSTTNQLKMSNGSTWLAAGGQWDLLGTVTPTGASPTIDFLTSFNNSIYGAYALDLSGIAPSSAGSTNLRVGSGGAIASSVYFSQTPGTSDTTASTSYEVTVGATLAAASATVGLSGTIYINYQGGGQDFVSIQSEVTNQTGASAATLEVRGGGALSSIGGGLTGVQLISGAGNWGSVGVVRLYGRRK